MPNWAIGEVQVKGSKQDVKEFCKYFLFDDTEIPQGQKYFARSFTNKDWVEFKETILNSTKGDIFSFFASFAWSAYSCLIDGSFKEDPDCITLEDACKKHNVEVKIHTSEPMLDFREYITFSDGELVYDSVDD